MTIQIEDIAVKAPMGVEGVVALVRAAADAAPDPAAAKLAAQARASLRTAQGCPAPARDRQPRPQNRARTGRGRLERILNARPQGSCPAT